MTHPHKAHWAAKSGKFAIRAGKALFRHACFRFFLKRMHLIVIPFVLVAAAEALNRRSWSGSIDWISAHPNEFALNCWIAFFLALLAAALAGSTRAAYGMLLGGTALLGIWSGVSMNRTGLPLLPWRVMLPGGQPDPVAPLNPWITSGLLAAAAGVAGLLVLGLLFPGTRLKYRERLLYGAAGLFLLFSAYLNQPIAFDDLLHITIFHYEQEASYNRNGFLASTLDNLRFAAPVRPKEAGSGDIRRLVRSLPSPSPAQADGAAPDKADKPDKATREHPNVVVLLSESFWDPTLLPEARFSEDPIPFFRSMMADTTGGWMLSPQFSGTTANVEFEVLTGNSVRFLPEDSIAYISYMNRAVDSLASVYSRQGYMATAVNPYFNWFFNSRNVYRNMGFSRFISCEFFEPRFHGPNFEDKQVMEKIIEAVDSTPGPDFIFANTMENHGSYENKFYSNPISVSGPMSAKARNILENYATGAHAFDKAFQSLVEHYRTSGEPTVILAFGDHLPGLGPNYLAYREAGYIGADSSDAEKMEKLQYTPFIIWDNMNLRPRESLRMNASFLGSYLLHYIGSPGTYYTDFLYAQYEKEPIFPIRAYVRAYPEKEGALDDYKRLQYDILFGRQEGYREKGIAGAILTSRFEMGYGSPVLERVYRDPAGKLVAEGGRFSSDSEVCLDGKALHTVYDSPHKLSVWPEDLPASLAGAWSVELADRKHTVISRSPVLVLPAEALETPSPTQTAAR